MGYLNKKKQMGIKARVKNLTELISYAKEQGFQSQVITGYEAELKRLNEEIQADKQKSKEMRNKMKEGKTE